MKIEMADNLSEREETQNVEAFLASGLGEQAEAMARISVSPTPRLVLDKKLITSGKDEELAQALLHVEVVDPNLKNLNIEDSEQDLATAVSLTAAKAKAMEQETEDLQERTALRQIRQKILGLGTKSLARGVRFAALTSLLVAACGPIISQENQEISSSGAVPTTAISPDILYRPETQGREVEDIIVFDAQERGLWELSNEDLSLIGTPTGDFEGWVDKNSVPWAGEGRDNPDVRFGRWINAGGRGILRFERNDDALISPDGIIIDSSDSSAWQITSEDRELAGNTPGHFDGWVPEGSITEEERQEGIRWGLWTNEGGQGRIRFEEASVATS